MSLKIIIAFIILLIFLYPIRSSAAMVVLSEVELSRLIAGAGVSVDIKGSARITVDSVYITDTDPAHDPWHKIEFNDIVIDDGAGGGFSFDTPAGMPITIDVGADASGRTIVRISGAEFFVSFFPPLISNIFPFNLVPLLGIPAAVPFLSSGSEPRYYRAGSIVFCNQDLGSLYMDRITQKDTILNIGAHGGVDFDYASRVDIGEFRYTYNTTPQSLKAIGIHLAGSATGALDDPSDPSTWEFTGPFKVGDLFSNPVNPATIDVGTNSSGKTSLFLNLPMQGCLRVEKVEFGGTDFGPCAIDGITVHRLGIQIPGAS